MSWLDALERRGREAMGIPVAPKPARQIVRPVADEPKPEIRTVWIQTQSPRDGDAGGCEAGFYSVSDGVVTMHDESGKATGKSQRLGPGDDARQIAGRLTREAWSKATGESDFNRPIHYARVGVA